MQLTAAILKDNSSQGWTFLTISTEHMSVMSVQCWVFPLTTIVCRGCFLVNGPDGGESNRGQWSILPWSQRAQWQELLQEGEQRGSQSAPRWTPCQACGIPVQSLRIWRAGKLPNIPKRFCTDIIFEDQAEFIPPCLLNALSLRQHTKAANLIILFQIWIASELQF